MKEKKTISKSWKVSTSISDLELKAIIFKLGWSRKVEELDNFIQQIRRTIDNYNLNNPELKTLYICNRIYTHSSVWGYNTWNAPDLELQSEKEITASPEDVENYLIKINQNKFNL